MRKTNYIYIALLFIGSAFFTTKSSAQTYEIGGLVGVNLYKGEVSPFINPLNLGYNLQFIARYNIDHQSTLRFNLAQSSYSASDNNNNNNLSKIRNSEISGSLGELSIIYEFNFFPYREDKSHLKVSPYLLGGIGAMTYRASGGNEINKGTSFNPVIPFGVGTKIILSKTLNFNLEFVTRKTFTDYLDNTHDEYKAHQNGYKNDNDWYSLLSLGITYTFCPIICPENF